MTLVRWQPIWCRSPFDGITTLQRQMNRLLEDTFPQEDGEPPASWDPRVNVTEFSDHFEVTVELPGMTRDEVKLELQENVLTISGEKHSEAEKKERNFYVCERSCGQFRRSFQFPTPIKSAEIDASFKDGVLTVALPKVEEAKPKQIEIKVH